MMNLVYKTLPKTSNFLHPSIPIGLYSSSLSFFSTKFPCDEQRSPPQSHIENKDETVVKEENNLARLSQIPYQSKVANLVNLIGTVRMPVKFLASGDGKFWAGTVISQEQFSHAFPLFWIPVIFEGDLAHTAVTHLKEDDIVYVAGHLSLERLPINLSNGQVNVQVMVRDLHFVRGLDAMKTHVYKILSRMKSS